MSPNLIETTNFLENIPLWAAITVIVFCVVISALCSASESAFSICNKYHFNVLADRGEKTPRLISFLVKHYDTTLITSVLMYNLMGVLLSNIAAIFFLSISTKYVWTDGIDTIVSTVSVTIIIYIFGDTIPKIVSKVIPNRSVYFLSYVILFFEIILFPIVYLYKGIMWLLTKIFKVEDKNLLTKEEFIEEADKAVLSEEDIDNNEKEEELLEKNEIRILRKAFNFDSISVNKVMTPIEDAISLDINNLNTKIVNDTILEYGYSRFPIYDEKPYEIVGILEVRTYFKEYSLDKHLDIRSCLFSPIFFNKDIKVDEVFEEFNRQKTHMGFIKDGDKVIGLITMEEILEQLVGDINEETLKLEENND